MYAVIRTGGKQYRITAGDILEVEKLSGAVGDTITLDDVLMVSNEDDVTVGQPIVDDASVTAKITGQYRGKKIMVFRYRPKKRIRVRRGHRQYLTRLEIESITAHGETYTRPVPQETTPEPEEEPVETQPAETAPVDETIAAAGLDENMVAATAVDEPVAEAQADETSNAVQEDFDSEASSEESDSEETDSGENSETVKSDDSGIEETDSEETDSEETDPNKKDKE